MSKILILFTIIFYYSFSLLSQEINQVDDMGRKQGKWRKTYTTGAIRYEGQFRNNQPFGKFKYYYQNTALKAVTQFSDDGIIARTKTYYENGKLMAEGKYINQQKDSLWKYYSEIEGTLVAEEFFLKGKLHGNSTTYFPDSSIPAEIIGYKDGLKDGVFIKYFPDGKVLLEGSFANDQLNGKYIVYFSDGSIEVEGKYKNGMKAGNWLYYNEAGKPITEDEYKEEVPE